MLLSILLLLFLQEAGADNVPMKIGLFVASNGIRYGSYGFLLGGLGLLGLVLGRASYRKYRENRKQTEIEMKEKSGDDNGYIGDYDEGRY